MVLQPRTPFAAVQCTFGPPRTLTRYIASIQVSLRQISGTRMRRGLTV